MALINCPECNKEISDKAKSCPNCGVPISTDENEEYLACPKCHSKDLHSEKSGFSGGKAFAGAVLTGGIGILAGTIGSKDIYLTCLKCNNRFKSGDALIIKKGNSALNLDKRIIESYKADENLINALRLYQSETKCSLPDAAKHVTNLLKENGIEIKKQSNPGCASMLLIFILVGSMIYMII